MKKAKTVDEYIANSDIKSKPIMEQLRKIINSTIPWSFNRFRCLFQTRKRWV